MCHMPHSDANIYAYTYYILLVVAAALMYALIQIILLVKIIPNNLGSCNK